MLNEERVLLVIVPE